MGNKGQRSDRIYPNDANQYQRMLWDLAYDSRDGLERLAGAVSGVADKIPTSQSIKKSLQSNGDSSLDVTALTGRLMTNQYAYVPKFSAVPSIKDPSAAVGDGTLVSVTSNPTGAAGGILYRFNEPLDLGSFIAQQAVGTTLSGTHSQRLASYPAANYEPGTLFYETDTHVLLIDELVGGVPTWIQLFRPTIIGTHAERTSLGTCNIVAGAVVAATGDNFFSGMVGHPIAVNGVLYPVLTYTDPTHITIDPAVTAAGATFFFSLYPSVDYPEGTFFWERDWKILDICVAETGVVDTNGTTVNWVSGGFFNPYWAGKTITIDGVDYRVHPTAAITPISLTLTGSAGIQFGKAYSVPSGSWQYVAGEWSTTLPLRTLGFGSKDEGFIAGDSGLGHRYRWSGTAWSYAPGDPGSKYIVAGIAAPIGGAWGLCDGSVYAVSNGTGGTVNVTSPNLSTSDFIRGGLSAHANAAAPSWDATAKTNDESAHTHNVPSQNTDPVGDHTHVIQQLSQPSLVGATSFPDAVDASTEPAGAHDHSIPAQDTSAGTAHHHTLTNANAKINPPSDANGGLPANIGLNWYIRL